MDDLPSFRTEIHLADYLTEEEDTLSFPNKIMTVMKKIILIAICLVSGCTGMSHSRDDVKAAAPERGPYAGKTSHTAPVITPAVSSYAAAVRDEITKHFFDVKRYRGKVCSLRLSMERNGTVNSVNTTGGDPKVCEAAVNAVKLSTLPPVPDEQTYKVFKNVALDFTP
ncbi:cell envelope integrity protein TolA [[Enterobacter] lignolyticus]|uniref:Tol-Pal system TolA n=1 Tax=Enterobacter lignolyticus (strain SCF1) TaxID=701347 RepID=E3G2N8_ENTLS|nr:cell envelope integrity protein TolA [[Enterobacter] lignolyticus]ADO48069.1 Tol-Pal system TolA [[Enterobacter] lignolyticus SCF1]